MGLLKGEGELLRKKYMKKYGLTTSEAITMVGKFIRQLNEVRDKMCEEKKMAIEIENAIQNKFEEEFQKLCAE